jgi:haloacetate dehalogenase
MSDSTSTPAPPFFPSFQRIEIEAGDVHFAGVMGGDGPPLLLLHGYPQTHIAWRKLAPELAKHYAVVIPDLPGYGSSRPREMSPRWTKRRAGDALAALMSKLGHDNFAIVGHDRGARVGYRLALDHPARILAFASLTVVPTADAMAAVDYRAAARAFHWFFFAQEADLPERLLAADPDAFIARTLANMTDSRDIIEPAALDAYKAAFRDPSVRHAICEDYRAALNEDLVLDNDDLAAGRKIRCPILVLWPEADRSPGQQTPVDTWLRWASEVSGKAISGGHLQPEDAPQEVLESLEPFLAQHTSLVRRR